MDTKSLFVYFFPLTDRKLQLTGAFMENLDVLILFELILIG